VATTALITPLPDVTMIPVTSAIVAASEPGDPMVTSTTP
jgi:hypothetical protein